jgi:hypothetical protein
MKLRSLAVIVSVTFWIAPSCASASPVGEITNVVVKENAIGSAAEQCRTYSVTSAQVKEFFQRAVLLSGRQHHDFFLHGPCSARGTLKTRYDTWSWEIRSLGTGTLTATNGDVFLFGDPRQESPPEG